MSAADLHNEVRYLISTEEDELWGLTVTGVGCQTISAEQSYPPEGHPQGYRFDVDEGRVLSEYQLLYITDGEGIFTYGEDRESQLITEGKMFFLFPGVWHTYKPFANCGWKEYWIGFKGATIDRIVAEGFFLNQAPVFSIGLNERIVDLYIKAVEIADEERSGFQQALSGIVMHMLGLMYYRHRTREFVDENVIGRINKAKVIMREGIYDNLSAKDVADRRTYGLLGIPESVQGVYRDVSRPIHAGTEAQRGQEAARRPRRVRSKEISFSLKYDSREVLLDLFQAAYVDDSGRVPSGWHVAARTIRRRSRRRPVSRSSRGLRCRETARQAFGRHGGPAAVRGRRFS